MSHHHHHQGCDSPLHRAVPPATVTTPSTSTNLIGQQPNGHVDNPSPRTARTLPPAPVSSSQVSSDDSCSPTVIPRRPTYPLSNKLKKSENSAFTPIGVSALREDDLASTATLVASQISIPHAIPPDTSSNSKSSTLTTAGATSFLNSSSIYSTAATATTAQSSVVADGGVSSISSRSEGVMDTFRHLSSVADHSGGRHVQPVATIPSHSSSNTTTTPVAAASTACATSADMNSVYVTTCTTGSGGVQKIANHVGSSLSSSEANTHPDPNAFNRLHHYHANGSTSSDGVVPISPPTNAQSGSQLSRSSGRHSEEHTLTWTHPNNVPNSEEVRGEVTSPGLNMEGGSSAYIDTVNQSYLAYAQPLPVGSIIQGSPHHHHHQYQLPHAAAAIMQQVMQPHAQSYLHNQTSPTSVVTSSIVSSNISPSPTLSETSNQSGGVPYSPGLMPYPPYSPIPQMYPHMSPLHSPIPNQGKKPGNNRRLYHGSNVSVNRMPTESDTLLAWLKSLRLHKYYSKFENTTFEEVSLCVCVRERETYMYLCLLVPWNPSKRTPLK